MAMDTMKSIENRLHDFGDQVVPQMEALEEKIQSAQHRLLHFIKQRPGTCLLGALAVGFVVGRVVRTRD
jgi:ElaB/YqjD/DUF883 family membrane-anchored ribosome-binding protein